MAKQATILKEVNFNGVGLHTANKTNVVLIPETTDKGIIFVRKDLPGSPEICASLGSLVSIESSPRRTTIDVAQGQIQTIEHLMAALSGLGIDNLRIELDNNELPGLDGSSLSYVKLIEQAGIKEQDKERNYFKLKEPIVLKDSNASIMALPSDEFKISYTLDYSEPINKTEFLEVNLSSSGVFKNEIAPARTFCLESEAKELQSNGLGLGANYENTLVLANDGTVIKNKVRFKNEFVRHKILDLIGDLYLIGCPLKAHIIAVKSGHSLNLKLVKEIAQQKERYSMNANKTCLEIEDIKKIIPHREPFIFVDRITDIEYGKRATGLKNVTINDYFFKGHFPGRPVMPGVIIVEAMAQVGAVMLLASDEYRGKLAFFMSIDNVKFRKPVVPGDQLILEVETVKVKSKIGQVRGKALVDGKVVAEADFICALVGNQE